VEWLAALGCPVVLLSATLPRTRREQLLKAYVGSDVVVLNETGYPRVSVVQPGKPVRELTFGVDPLNHKTLHLHRVVDDLPRLVERLAKELAEGGCACVIRNTVGKAQETYLALEQALGPLGVRVELFHARFLFGRRQEIESRVLRDYGKGDTGSPSLDSPRPARVLVATQVVEQSLDLDFDLMVSDLAPVDLILQRLGRLHRHRRERPPGLRYPMLWLLEPGQEEGVPVFGHSEYIYARYILLRTYQALAGKTTIILPTDIELLIEAVYSQENGVVVSAAFAASLAAAREAERKEDKARKTKAGVVITPKPARANEILDEMIPTQDEDDDPRTHESRKAATRDTDPTVSLVVIYHRDGKDFLSPTGGDPVNLDIEPSVLLARDILRNAVTVSHGGCVATYAWSDPPRGWRKSGLLRFHRIIRVDADGVSLPCEFPVTVCREIGVQFTRDADREL
jgi:CRISPR-associated endonuclease/helicase Cas3